MLAAGSVGGGQSQALLMLAGSAKMLEPGSVSSPPQEQTSASSAQQFQPAGPFFSHGVAPSRRPRHAAIGNRSHSAPRGGGGDDDGSGGGGGGGGGGGAAKARASETARTLRKQDIVKYFHLTVAEAARQFGLGRTCFKSVCRREGIHEWPRPTRVIRRPNLRPAKRSRPTPAEHGPLTQISNYIGVFWNQRDNKWQAQITHEHHTEYLGSFTDEQGGEVEAARAFDAAARLKRRQQIHSSPDAQTRWVLNFPSEEDRRYDVESAARAQQGHLLQPGAHYEPQLQQLAQSGGGKSHGGDDLPGVEALALLAALHKSSAAAGSDQPTVKQQTETNLDALLQQQVQYRQQQLQLQQLQQLQQQQQQGQLQLMHHHHQQQQQQQHRHHHHHRHHQQEQAAQYSTQTPCAEL